MQFIPCGYLLTMNTLKNMNWRVSLNCVLIVMLKVIHQHADAGFAELHKPQKSSLVFPSSYVTEGVQYFPYSEIEEPFTAWYDADISASRINYYGGVTEIFHLGKEGPYGTSRKIVPISTERAINVKTCFEEEGSSDNIIEPQKVIPESGSYKFHGVRKINGIEAEKWKLAETYGQELIKYTIYIKYQKSTKNSNESVPIPVRYTKKYINTVSHLPTDYFTIEFANFSDEKPHRSIFEEKTMKCHEFYNADYRNSYDLNPMAQFIDGYEEYVNRAFEDFKITHNKKYDSEEHYHRKNVFKHNLRFINYKNRANLGYILGTNSLADRTPDELKDISGHRYSPSYNGGKPFPYNAQKEIKKLPRNFDWRIQGVVTPVKEQGKECRACWSFASAGAVESEYSVFTGKQVVPLSSQALIDCSWGFGNNGCDGGYNWQAFSWILKHGGIPTEEEYGPYYGQDSYCHLDNVTLIAKITGWVNVTPESEDALKVALFRHGPISVAIHTSLRSFWMYSNGIYYDPQCSDDPKDLDHEALLVGYGILHGEKYWLVKNSWSHNWGIDGYILIAVKNNTCGVMTSPMYVTF